MVLGFNHNVMYKGEIFHVQTEDSGTANPHIITLLYKGGVILCSKKTSYADILKMDNLEEVVEELMKEQHKELMRRLKAGEFDERAFAIEASNFENYVIESPEPLNDPVADIFASTAQKSSSAGDISLLFEVSSQPNAVPAQQSPQKETPAKDVVNLDDAILTFFGAKDK